MSRLGLALTLLLYVATGHAAAMPALSATSSSRDAPVRVPLTRRRTQSKDDITGATAPRAGRRRAEDTVYLHGDFKTTAYQYAVLYIGVPPVPFDVIIDTGSSLTAVPCDTCTECGSHSGRMPWSPTSSSTSRTMRCSDTVSAGPPSPSCLTCNASGACEFSQSYLELSHLRGTLYRDRAFFGEAAGASAVSASRLGVPHAVYSVDAAVIGCTTHEVGLFRSQAASGVVGLGAGADSLITALAAAGLIRRHVFAVCSAPEASVLPAAPLDVGVGGFLSLGEADLSLHAAPAQFSDMIATESGLYVVAITDMAVGSAWRHGSRTAAAGSVWELSNDTLSGASVIPVWTQQQWAAAAALPAAVDSGSTFSYLPLRLLLDVHAAVMAWCATGDGAAAVESATVAAAGSGGRGDPIGGHGDGRRCAGMLASMPPSSSSSSPALCFSLADPERDVYSLPGIAITLVGAAAAAAGGSGDSPPSPETVVVTVAPTAAWLPASDSHGDIVYCLAFYGNGYSGGAGMGAGGTGARSGTSEAVLGMNVMLSHDVIFDVDGSRIGWAPSACGAADALERSRAVGGGGGIDGSTVDGVARFSAWLSTPGLRIGIACGVAIALLALALLLCAAVACCGARIVCRCGRTRVLMPAPGGGRGSAWKGSGVRGLWPAMAPLALRATFRGGATHRALPPDALTEDGLSVFSGDSEKRSDGGASVTSLAPPPHEFHQRGLAQTAPTPTSATNSAAGGWRSAFALSWLRSRRSGGGTGGGASTTSAETYRRVVPRPLDNSVVVVSDSSISSSPTTAHAVPVPYAQNKLQPKNPLAPSRAAAVFQRSGVEGDAGGGSGVVGVHGATRSGSRAVSMPRRPAAVEEGGRYTAAIDGGELGGPGALRVAAHPSLRAPEHDRLGSHVRRVHSNRPAANGSSGSDGRLVAHDALTVLPSASHHTPVVL